MVHVDLGHVLQEHVERKSVREQVLKNTGGTSKAKAPCSKRKSPVTHFPSIEETEPEQPSYEDGIHSRERKVVVVKEYLCSVSAQECTSCTSARTSVRIR